MENLKKLIREVPDFPKEGINFYDITTLLKDKDGLRETLDAMVEKYKDTKIDSIIGIESRGFIFATPMAHQLDAGFIPVRKPGKLPAETETASYQLEYGEDILEIHKDAINEGDNILIVDDLLATGGTAEAVIKLVEKLKGNIVGVSFLCELTFLKGREKLNGYDVHSFIKYDD